MKQIKATITTRALEIIKILRKATLGMTPPAGASIVKKFGRDPYLVLISCLLSLRAKDSASLPASIKLFEYAKTPQDMIKIPLKKIEEIIFITGFYRNKAKTILSVSRELLERFNGIVPHTKEELMSLKGVGPKTAALVMADGFEIPAICVDVHVHRISNRLGLIQTKTVEETEVELKKILPKENWREWNSLMVMWGQNICVPVSPKCSICPIFDLCQRVGVNRSR
ncbi:MAG: endonuclease III [Candidatus Babeliales bacterium]|nr:endonuclease III [Candidatus Babeliales bacterium]